MRPLFTCIILILVTLATYGQNNSNNQYYAHYEQTVLPPSPDAASLARYIDYPVTLSSGLPEITIPLYTITSKLLSVPISISYHAAGIKVSERNGSLGAGWALNAGGNISRTVKDIPDEAQYGYFHQVYPDENGSAVTNQKLYCLSEQIIDTYTEGRTKYDGEPDEFFYTFGGMSGMFLYRNRTAIGIDPQPVPIPYSPIKITGNFVSFETTDLAGNTYTFGDVQEAREGTLAGGGYMRDYGTILSGWNLTKIVSADRTDTISFTYEAGNVPYDNSITSATGELRIPFIGPANATTATVYTTGSPADDEVRSHLKEIKFNNGKVVFTYNFGLSNVEIYSGHNGNYIKIKACQIYQSTYSNSTRTRLDSLQETGYINGRSAKRNPSYRFSYYTPDAPPINSKDQDFWGFYNGRGNTDMLYVKSVSTGLSLYTKFVPAPEKRKPDEEMNKKGVLQRITYPTGGYTDFDLEANKVDTTYTYRNLEPQSVSHAIRTFNMMPNDPTTGISIIFKPDSQAIGQAALTITGNFTCTSSSACAPNIPEAILFDITANKQIADILLANLYHNQVTSQTSTTYYNLDMSHQYRLYFPTPGHINAYGDPVQYRIDAIITETLPDRLGHEQTAHETVLSGGLRVKRITHNDGKGNMIIKRYKYLQPYFNNPILFNGSYDYIINNLSKPKYIYTGGYSGYKPSSTPVGPQENYEGLWVKRSQTYTEGVNVPVGGNSGSALSYAVVEEDQTDANGTALGKTLYTFNKTTDYFSNQFPMFRISRDFLRSQLLDTKVYKTGAAGNYILLKQTTNTYNNINDYQPDDPGRDSIKFYKTYNNLDYQYYLENLGGGRLPNAYSDLYRVSNSLGCPIYDNMNLKVFLYNAISPFYYHVVRPLLTSVLTTDYDMNGNNPVTAKTNYVYDNLVHIQPTQVITTNSDQKVTTVSSKYPLDYNLYPNFRDPQGCIVNFNQQLATLKAQRQQCQQNAMNSSSKSDANILAQAVAAFDQCETDYNNAVAQLVSQYNNCYSIYRQYVLSTENSLGATDKAIAHLQDNNMITEKVMATTVVNGTQTQLVKTDYQIIDVGVGNNVKPQQVNVQVANHPLEPRVSFTYNNSGNITQQQQISGPPVAYLWGYNSQYPIAEVKNASYQTLVDVLGQQMIDQLSSNALDTDVQVRTALQPLRTDPRLKNSLVTTYTYAPLIGMTSSTDAKGQTTYYEYDSFQRLLNIKDQNGNVLKHYEYHYQNQ